MDPDSKSLIKELKSAGLSDAAIKAAWPSWWDDDAASSASARAELRFALSRKLGLSPRSLLGERVEFVWQDDARFKNLTAGDSMHRGALASFGVAVGRLLLRATPTGRGVDGIAAQELRRAILADRPSVDLAGLVYTCWGLGIPVIHFGVFPLRTKSMRAMVVEVEGRHAIMLGRDAAYPAPTAFTLAHEIGHAALGHIGSGKALVDIGDSSRGSADVEEREADTYALDLLTGSKRPEIVTNIQNFSARALARACEDAGPQRRIEPGTLALCVGYVKEKWAVANAALKHIYPARANVKDRQLSRRAPRICSWRPSRSLAFFGISPGRRHCQPPAIPSFTTLTFATRRPRASSWLSPPSRSRLSACAADNDVILKTCKRLLCPPWGWRGVGKKAGRNLMSPTMRLQNAPRCTARSKRTGVRCQGPAVRGHHVCRFHGAWGGAPSGPANGAYRHGEYTAEAVETRRALAALLKQARASLDTSD